MLFKALIHVRNPSLQLYIFCSFSSWNECVKNYNDNKFIVQSLLNLKKFVIITILKFLVNVIIVM